MAYLQSQYYGRFGQRTISLGPWGRYIDVFWRKISLVPAAKYEPPGTIVSPFASLADALWRVMDALETAVRLVSE